MTRILLLVSTVSLCLAFAFPIWKIRLEAPQYPEGLGLLIGIHSIEGEGPHDLQNINGLNHYVGMARIEPGSFPELRLMPLILAALIGFGLITLLAGRRRLLYLYALLFLGVAIAGLIDFHHWEYTYGHTLNPTAAIKVPGLAYQPPLIGSKKLLNFTAHSWPGLGGWLTIGAFGLVALAALIELRRPRAASMLVALFLLGACQSSPRPVRFGDDQCAYCLMGVADERFAAELITREGRTHVFDSIECLVRFLDSDSTLRVRSIWVTDWETPPRLIDARRAAFLRSDGIDAPMGAGIAAFATQEARDARLRGLTGGALTWSELRAYVDSDSAAFARYALHGHDRTEATAVPAIVGTVSEMIREAAQGSTVVVPPGVYREATIVVDKPIELVGHGVVLDGEGRRAILLVRADDVTVRGFVLRNVGVSHVEDRAAIRVESARRCRIEGNRVEDGFFGIYIAGSSDCIIRNNDLTSRATRETAAGNGIHVWHSDRITIEDNSVRGYRDGLYFEFVTRSAVRRNDSGSNLRYGLHFMFSDDCDYERNRFRANGAGVAVMYTAGVEMEANEFESNRGPASFGLLLKDIRDSRITDNRFRDNGVGLYAEGSNRLTVSGNTFEANGWAVKVMSNSETNRFTSNDFMGNSFDVVTNGRRNDSRFRGNYWDAYDGLDLDHDGVGDVPHRPVRLFSVLIERNPPSLILMRSPFVALLDAAESVLPMLTPETLIDEAPRMRPVHPGKGDGA